MSGPASPEKPGPKGGGDKVGQPPISASPPTARLYVDEAEPESAPAPVPAAPKASGGGGGESDELVFVDDLDPSRPSPHKQASIPMPGAAASPAPGAAAIGLAKTPERGFKQGGKAAPGGGSISTQSDKRRLSTSSERLRVLDAGTTTAARQREQAAGARTRTSQEDARLAGFDVQPGAQDDLSKGKALGSWKILDRVGQDDRVVLLLVERDGQQAVLRYHPVELCGAQAVDAIARADRATTVRHEALEPVLDQGRADAGTWFVVPDATTLETRLSWKGRLPEGEALALVRGAAKALAALHARNLVHGDPSPRNLVEGEGVVRLGTPARVLVGRATEALGLQGDARYAAPEVLDGQPPTAASDVFTLGLTLGFLLTGRPPVKSDDAVDAVIERARTGIPSLPEGTAREAIAIYAKATADVVRRYPTADELARDLDAAVAGKVSAIAPLAERPPAVATAARPTMKQAALAIIIALAVFILILSFTLSQTLTDPAAEHAFELPAGAPR